MADFPALPSPASEGPMDRSWEGSVAFFGKVFLRSAVEAPKGWNSQFSGIVSRISMNILLFYLGLAIYM